MPTDPLNSLILIVSKHFGPETVLQFINGLFHLTCPISLGPLNLQSWNFVMLLEWQRSDNHGGSQSQIHDYISFNISKAFPS